MEEEEKLGQRSIDAGSSTRSFTPPSVMHLSAADKAWQSRRLRVMFSPTPALLPRAVSALSLHSQRFLNTMPELLRKSNKKIWQREQTQRGHLKNWTQAAIHFVHGKALQIQKKRSSCLSPPSLSILAWSRALAVAEIIAICRLACSLLWNVSVASCFQQVRGLQGVK